MSDVLQTSEIIEDELEYFIDSFCQKYGIDDMSKETQQRWNACMTYIYNNHYKGTNYFKYNPNINNKYDTSKLDAILEQYMYYCELFSKAITITGFVRLTGISRDIIERWRKESSSNGFGISKKLDSEGRESLLDRMLDDNHFMGTNQRGRIEYGFDGSIESSKQSVLESVNALPTFDNVPQIAGESELKSV